MTTEELRFLLALQDIDTDADRHRHRRAALPPRAELAAVDGRIGELKRQVDAATAARDEFAGRQGALEAELTLTEERAAAVNRRLYSGEVSASRELQAMAADADTLRTRASQLEDEVLALLDEREPADRRVADLTSEAAELAARRAGAVGALGAAEAAIDTELAVLDRRRVEVAAAVPAALLALYEQLRAHLGGVAVSHLVGGRCDGCHLSLPATELDRIRHLPPGEIVTCDQCGRILVRP